VRFMLTSTAATGAGVIAGGVLIGVTGGLAAPAIAALLAPLGIGGLLSASAAPVVLGTLFGVGGGGLAGRRVRERWRGVEEFGFVEVGAGTKASVEEIEDLHQAKQEAMRREEKRAKEEQEGKEAEEKELGLKEGEGDAKEMQEEDVDRLVAKEVEQGRIDIEERLLKLSLEAGHRSSISQADKARRSLDSPRQSLDTAPEEKAILEVQKPPSLTVCSSRIQGTPLELTEC
jgi:hypothetical protein